MILKYYRTTKSKLLWTINNINILPIKPARLHILIIVMQKPNVTYNMHLINIDLNISVEKHKWALKHWEIQSLKYFAGEKKNAKTTIVAFWFWREMFLVFSV